jgi:glycine/D-amino acid oxidase-like deaminating enzyme
LTLAGSRSSENFDAVIIGGGFYGCAIAAYLAKQRGMRQVLLVEREARLLTRASYSNQARVHNGYHYPRSFTTAYRSRINLPQFVRDWPAAVKRDFTKLYAVARHNSKINSRQFQRFCREIGVPLEPAEASLRQLFEPRLIEDVFLAQEYVFDTAELGRRAERELADGGVQIRFETAAGEIGLTPDDQLQVVLTSSVHPDSVITGRYVFNCTYSGLNQLLGKFPGTVTPLKHEITEMPLMKMPPALERLGITVMDGPFFSVMPFPARGLHTLSHVRYTPHLHWQDDRGIDPYRKLHDYARESRSDRMVRDVARFLPAIRDACYVDSLFEVKTVLLKNEGDDGRPILFEMHPELPGCISILGGKIDNIYDVIERLAALMPHPGIQPRRV